MKKLVFLWLYGIHAALAAPAQPDVRVVEIIHETINGLDYSIQLVRTDDEAFNTEMERRYCHSWWQVNQSEEVRAACQRQSIAQTVAVEKQQIRQEKQGRTGVKSFRQSFAVIGGRYWQICDSDYNRNTFSGNQHWLSCAVYDFKNHFVRRPERSMFDFLDKKQQEQFTALLHANLPEEEISELVNIVLQRKQNDPQRVTVEITHYGHLGELKRSDFEVPRSTLAPIFPPEFLPAENQKSL